MIQVSDPAFRAELEKERDIPTIRSVHVSVASPPLCAAHHQKAHQQARPHRADRERP